MQHSLWDTHVIFNHSNLSPCKFATFLINQDIEGEIAELTAIKAGRSSLGTDVTCQDGRY